MVLYVKSRMQKGNVSMSENVNVCEYIESKCVHVEADCFDLEQIMESGQCFRIYKLSLQEQERVWRIVKAWHGIESWLQIKKFLFARMVSI